jgi:hypothetical protein
VVIHDIRTLIIKILRRGATVFSFSIYLAFEKTYVTMISCFNSVVDYSCSKFIFSVMWHCAIRFIGSEVSRECAFSTLLKWKQKFPSKHSYLSRTLSCSSSDLYSGGTRFKTRP